MLPIKPEGWTSLQTLRSHLAGRLVRFSRNPHTGGNRVSRPVQNGAAFFETDLRYIFTMIPSVGDVPHDEYDDVDHAAHDLMDALDGMVNQALLEPLETPRTEEPKDTQAPSSNNIGALSNWYPRLGSLLTLVEVSTGQFELVIGQDSPLFVLPDGQAGNVAMDCLTRMKRPLERVSNGARKQHGPQLDQLLAADSLSLSEESSQSQHGAPRKPASVVVNALFNDIRQGNCGKLHEIKLKVPEEWQDGLLETPLDMFLSCCLDQGGWHQTKCGSFQ